MIPPFCCFRVASFGGASSFASPSLLGFVLFFLLFLLFPLRSFFCLFLLPLLCLFVFDLLLFFSISTKAKSKALKCSGGVRWFKRTA